MMAVPPSALRISLRACLALAFATLVSPAWGDSLPDASTNEVVALRSAITDLTTTYGSRYPGGKSFLAQLNQMGQKTPLPREDFEKLRREALIANPLVRATWEKNTPAGRQAFLDGVAVKRLGTPEEIAEAVLYFVSPQAAYTTGQTLLVDGGHYMF